jgi:hypothetical protein
MDLLVRSAAAAVSSFKAAELADVASSASSAASSAEGDWDEGDLPVLDGSANSSSAVEGLGALGQFGAPHRELIVHDGGGFGGSGAEEADVALDFLGDGLLVMQQAAAAGGGGAGSGAGATAAREGQRGRRATAAHPTAVRPGGTSTAPRVADATADIAVGSHSRTTATWSSAPGSAASSAGSSASAVSLAPGGGGGAAAAAGAKRPKGGRRADPASLPTYPSRYIGVSVSARAPTAAAAADRTAAGAMFGLGIALPPHAPPPARSQWHKYSNCWMVQVRNAGKRTCVGYFRCGRPANGGRR